MAHLPAQLAEVDPIVASFCGGAVGVLSTLMLVEANNSKMQAANRCIYCGVGPHPLLSICLMMTAFFVFNGSDQKGGVWHCHVFSWPSL